MRSARLDPDREVTDAPAACRTRRRHAFTLLELLVVVSLIVLLVAMLLPALGNARFEARNTVCFSNQKQIFDGCVAYAMDHDRRYPSYPTWSTLLGKRGTDSAYNSTAYGVEDRVLNRYVGYTLAQCPSDIGDSHPAWGGRITNCYEQYGNSYQPPWSIDVLRTVYVFGVPNTVDKQPKHLNSFSHPANKVVIGDFGWWLNRPWSDPRTRWHSKSDERNEPIAFADGHVAWMYVPAEYDAAGQNLPPDPGFIWW